MKSQLLTALLAVVASAAAAHDELGRRHAKRQLPSSSPSTAATTRPTGATPAAPAATSASPVLDNEHPAGTAPPPPNATGGIPPLAQLSFGMPTRATVPVAATFAPGSKSPVNGAPTLPRPSFQFKSGEWPQQDKIPPTDSDEVNEWLLELEGFNIPDYRPTKDGSCVNDTEAAGEAATRGWWTCGGHVRGTDIVACPDKLTWGVSFDDGPSPYTQNLLNYLQEKKLQATFFVVGSRVIERPQLLVEEYMQGHEISVHTWSHNHLTKLTNEQVVAELGWTRKAIKEVIGVTPTTMRPPFGDIDDRVRAIALAMGLVPILWTRTPAAGQFDTNDWRVAGGLVSGTDSYNTFQGILSTASELDTGFIVLQHDLYEISIDLAVGYTLNAALTHNPPFNLKSIGQCMKLPAANLYLESNTNKSFPYTNHTKIGGASLPIGLSIPAYNVLIASVLAIAGMFWI